MWVKKYLKPLKADEIVIGCLTCSSAAVKASLKTPITAYGEAYITKDGKMVYDGGSFRWEEIKEKTLQTFENMARKEPNADWRFVRYTALHGETFQRQGNNNWVCVKSNKGFA